MISESITKLSLPYRGRSKTVRVFVPAHEEGETFPVVYMTDGQNLFESENLQFGCWYTREAVAEERAQSGMAAIIVGIHNDDAPWERTNDLTPAGIGPLVESPEIPPEVKALMAPRGEEFDAFVVDTVMPAVEARFPVQKGRQSTAFCGSSSGGLQSYFTALSHPDKFCAAGVFSPAFLFYSPDDLRSWTVAQLGNDMPFLYLYTGGGDDLEQVIAMFTEQAYDMLTEFYPPEKLCEVVLPEEKHHESAWAPRFSDFLHTFLARREEF